MIEYSMAFALSPQSFSKGPGIANEVSWQA